MGVFAGFSSAAIALVASQVPEGRLGYALGWLSTGQLVGSLVGPLIGGALADLTGRYRIPFYCTSATILLSLALVWFAVDERFVAPPKARGSRSMLGSLIAVAGTPVLLALFFLITRLPQPIPIWYNHEQRRLVEARNGSQRGPVPERSQRVRFRA